MSSTSQPQREIDLAWAAGFIDGEGCIALNHHKQNLKGKPYQCFVLRLSVANTDLLSLDRLKAMFGGSINLSHHDRKAHHKRCWTWYVTSVKAQDALLAVLPYLFTKKTQAEVGLASRRYIQSNGRPREANMLDAQHRIFVQLKQLKRVA